MEFTVKIRLENDSMRTGENIAIALAGVMYEIEQSGMYTRPVTGEDARSGKIRDGNGNITGEWSIR